MSTAIMLDLPETLYQRLVSAAKATHRPLEEVVLRALRVGSPPGWEDAPKEVQAELSTLDRLDDDSLYRVARERWSPADVARYDELLERHADGRLSKEERGELAQMREAHDLLVLRRAHAAALLRWRGRAAPLL